MDNLVLCGSVGQALAPGGAVNISGSSISSAAAGRGVVVNTSLTKVVLGLGGVAISGFGKGPSKTVAVPFTGNPVSWRDSWVGVRAWGMPFGGLSLFAFW